MKKNSITQHSIRFEELDSLRGIASIIVVLFHFTMGREQADYGFNLGVTGVDLFFIISGFVIFFSLERTNNLKQFFVNRFYRIFPTYWLGVTYTFSVILVYSLLTKDFSLLDIKQYLVNLTMIQTYFGVKDLDGPYWTMLVELIFYIYVAFLYKLKRAFDLVTCLLIAFTLVLVYFFFDSDFIFLFYKVPFIQFTPLFFAGVVFYKRKMLHLSTLYFVSFIILCYSAQLLLFKYSGKSSGQVSFIQYFCMLTIYFSLFYLFVENKLKFLINKYLIYLGKISFALYLIHQRVSVNFIIPILTKKFYLSFFLSSVIALSISIVSASIITFYFEKKLVTFIKKVTSLFKNPIF